MLVTQMRSAKARSPIARLRPPLGVIAGLTIGLVQGYKPEDLSRIQVNLDKVGTGLQEFCNNSIAVARAAKGKRGLIDKIVTAAVGPVIDAPKSGAAALWSQHIQMAKLEREMIEKQLEAAKWPDFGP